MRRLDIIYRTYQQMEAIVAIVVVGKVYAVTSCLLSQVPLSSVAESQSLSALQSHIDKQFSAINTSINVLRDSHLQIAQSNFKDGLTAFCSGNAAQARRYFVEAEKEATAAFYTTTLAFEGKSCAIRIKNYVRIVHQRLFHFCVTGPAHDWRPLCDRVLPSS